MSRMKPWIYLALILSLIGLSCTGSHDKWYETNLDLVLLNGKVWTGWEVQPWVEAIAIQNDRIIAVGSSNEMKPFRKSAHQVIDLNQRLVVPGFNDAHVHFHNGGSSLLEIQLRDAKDEAEFAARIQQKTATLAAGEWITGGHWDHENWPSQKLPDKSIIDPVSPNNPVLVSRLDGHVAVANSVALKLAGITAKTTDPQGGKIERHPETGEPTGILWDTAIDIVQTIIPAETKDQVREAIEMALNHAAEMGVTSIQDNSSAVDLTIYQEFLRKNELTVRVNAWRPASTASHFRQLGIEMPFGNSMLKVGTMKIFADGSMGAGSAYFFEPYADEPGTAGLAIYSEAELNEMVQKIDAARLQIAIHAIGDKANHIVLNAYEQAFAKNGRRETRHRIEHAQVVTDADLQRFKKLDVVASIQPCHCIDDMRWAEKRIGKDRCKIAYRFKSFVDAGVQLAFGTDWPVEPLNPMLGLYAAVTREFPEGGPAGGWFPKEKITMAQAIEFYTSGSAYAEFAEQDKGTLQPGKLADLVVLSQNLFEIEPKEILQTRVLMTIVGGRIVYEEAL